MFKKLTFSSFVLYSSLFAESTLNQETEKLQMGRYQMCAVSSLKGYIPLYLLDASTGCVRKSDLESNWFEHDSWVSQITNAPPPVMSSHLRQLTRI